MGNGEACREPRPDGSGLGSTPKSCPVGKFGTRIGNEMLETRATTVAVDVRTHARA